MKDANQDKGKGGKEIEVASPESGSKKSEK